jgi:hypothetical protein
MERQAQAPKIMGISSGCTTEMAMAAPTRTPINNQVVQCGQTITLPPSSLVNQNFETINELLGSKIRESADYTINKRADL